MQDLKNVKVNSSRKRVYVIYDARARYATYDASVYAASDSLQEAIDTRNEHFTEGIIYSYLRDAQGFLVDERFEE